MLQLVSWVATIMKIRVNSLKQVSKPKVKSPNLELWPSTNWKAVKVYTWQFHSTHWLLTGSWKSGLLSSPAGWYRWYKFIPHLVHQGSDHCLSSLIERQLFNHYLSWNPRVQYSPIKALFLGGGLGVRACRFSWGTNHAVSAKNPDKSHLFFR